MDAPDERRGLAALRLRLLLALLAVAALQIVVVTAGDSRFGSGSDAGGRQAAVAAAEANGGCDHDLGYWAADGDPEGAFHPLANTERVGDRYVQPADIAFVCGSAAASSLGASFGLSLSILGVVLAALGAWMLDRASGGGGWLALVMVGALGAVAPYGADVWEHAPAAGAAVLGTALLLTDRRLGTGAIAGVLWGAAVSLRIETGIVAAALALVLLVTSDQRRRLLRLWPRHLLFGASALATLFADRFLEEQVLTSGVRDARLVGGGGAGGGGQVAQAGADLGQRLRDVFVTNLGVLANDRDLAAVVLGVIFIAALAVLAASVLRGRPEGLPVVAAGIVAGAVVVQRFLDRGFVPGMFAAAPLAMLGALVAVQRRAGAPISAVLARAALLALPVVWVFQWTGSLTAQWGGRYQLTSSAFLTVAALPALRSGLRRTSGRTLVGVAVAVGLLGLSWHAERTHRTADAFERLRDVPCEGVLISAQRFFLREGGGLRDIQRQQLGDCRLLSADPASVPGALAVAAHLGHRQAMVVYHGIGEIDPRSLAPWTVESVGTGELDPELPITVVGLSLD